MMGKATDTLKHREAAYDVSHDREHMRPSQIFMRGDRIQVHGLHTKHHGRIARVNEVGTQRLSVTFEDGQSGNFVQYTDAVVIPERGQNNLANTPARLKTKDRKPSPKSTISSKIDRDITLMSLDGDGNNEFNDKHTLETIQVIDQLSMVTATMISRHYDDEELVEQLIGRFTARLRLDTHLLARQRADEK